MARHRLTFLAVLLLLTPSACDQQPTAATTGVVPRFNHVFIVVEENTDYADVIGGTAMVYLDSLAHEYGLATQYYGDAHPSIGNYFMMTVGDTITDNDGYSSIVTADNIVRRLVAAGKTWKSYAEDLPSVGYTGGDVRQVLGVGLRSEEHTSELQSPCNLVCRLLLEKKKTNLS